ncbi:hypothetical protein L7F22_021915 [Adiantum nelumboides]|nr:hypothetical protein [Adiantum nelumboides]
MEPDPAAYENMVVGEGDVRKIILDYLIHNCLRETTEAFISCTGMKCSFDWSAKLDKRKTIYTYAMEGNIMKAIELTNELASDLLQNNQDVLFELLMLHFVELIRSRNCTGALEFAQRELTTYGNRKEYIEKLQPRSLEAMNRRSSLKPTLSAYGLTTLQGQEDTHLRESNLFTNRGNIVRMDGYKEEGSSSQDRQYNPTVHEVGEGSSQVEEGFPHAAFSITGTASPGTLFGGMQSMVPNSMYANIGLHPGFQGTQGWMAGSSSQDRQYNPTVHEVGEGSSQVEEGFPHAAFSITGTASPGTLFGGMQSMVPNSMYANIGLHPGFQGTQGQFGVSQGNLGMAGFSIPPVNMTPRHQHVTGQGVQMAPTGWIAGSSSQDRQYNPTVHEVGEGSSQVEEGFPHAAFSITGTASPGTLFGGMQSMVPNSMYANIGLHPGFQGTQGQFGVSQGNLGMAGFSIPPVNMTPRHQHVTGQGVQMAPTVLQRYIFVDEFNSSNYSTSEEESTVTDESDSSQAEIMGVVLTDPTMDVMTLLAYDEPETSPVYELLSMDHRHSVAEKLNRIVLSHLELPSTSSLERILQQVTVVRCCLNKDGGKDGWGPFSLTSFLKR